MENLKTCKVSFEGVVLFVLLFCLFGLFGLFFFVHKPPFPAPATVRGHRLGGYWASWNVGGSLFDAFR